MFRAPLARVLAAAGLALAGCASGPSLLAPQGPARSDALFSQIQRGMTREDVVRLAGPPDQQMPFPMTHSYGWDYRYFDTWGYPADFSVTFGPDDRVASTIVRRFDAGGDHGK